MDNSLYLKSKHRASSTKSLRLWSICTSTEFSIVTSNRKICWLTHPDKTSNWPILVLLEPLVSQSRLTLTRSSHFGTVAQRSSSARKPTRSASIFGRLGASSQKWSNESRSSWEILKSIRSSKFSRFSAHPTRIIGQMLSSWTTSNQLSPSSVACQWATTHQLWMKWR